MGSARVLVAFALAACGARTNLDAPPPPPELALGAIHSCVIGVDGEAHCWGSALDCDTSLDMLICNNAPLAGPSGAPASRISASDRFGDGGYTCLLDGTALRCIGNRAGEDYVVPNVGPTVAVQTSYEFTCALGTDGRVRCFGEVPMLGSFPPAAPASMAGLSDVVAIAASSSGYPGHACALEASGRAFCWGRDTEGQLGDGTSANTSPGSATPVAVVAPVAFDAIAAGAWHTCALDPSGEPWCWGAVEGSTPVRITGLPGPASRLAVGGVDACALLADETVWCWGKSYGSGSRVQGLDGVAAIGLGLAHACAVKHDGSVWCWGSNSSYSGDTETGQLGVSGMASSAVPVQASW